MRLYKAGVWEGLAPKNKTGNSINACNRGLEKYFLTCLLNDLNTSTCKLFQISLADRYSVTESAGLYTNCSIPKRYFCSASCKNLSSALPLPGSMDSNRFFRSEKAGG